MVWPLSDETQSLVIGGRSSGTVRWGTRTPLHRAYIAVGETSEIQVSEADWHGPTLDIEREWHYPQRQLQMAIRAATSGHGMRLNAVEARLEALEAKVAQYPVAIPIYEVPGFRLVAPLGVLVERVDGGYLARIPELDLWSDGRTQGDALESAKLDFADLANDLLEAPDDSLGRIPRGWKRTLARLVVRA